jgi:PAS domain S-box-containing protein
LKFDFKVFAGSVLAASIVWVSDTLLDHLFFSQSDFADLLIFDVPEQKIFIRLLIFFYFFLFGSIISAYFSAQKKSVEELQDIKFRYKTVADKTNDWEFWKNTKGDYNYIAPAFEKITGYLIEDLTHDPSLITRIIHPDDLIKVLKHFDDETKNTMEVSELDFRIITQNKLIKTIKHTCQPVYDKYGKFKGTRGCNIDISVMAVENRRSLLNDAILQTELQSSEKGIYAVDSSGKIVLVNEQFGILWNIPSPLLKVDYEENLMGLIESKLKNPVSQLKKLAMINKNTHDNFSDQLLLENGRKIEIISIPIRNSTGEYLGRIWNFSEAKKSGEIKNDVIGEYNNLFETLFENGTDAFFNCDLKGTFISGNKAAEKLTGYKREELTGKNFLKLKLMSIPDIVRIVKLLSEIREGKTTGPDEFVLYKKDGTTVAIELSLYPVKKNADTIVFGVLRDISLRKEKEKYLTENEQKLRSITESVNDAIVMSNINGEISFWNSAAEKIFGYKKEEVLGENLANLIFPEDFAKDYWNRYKKFGGSGKDPLIGEITNILAKRKNGANFLIGLSISVVELNGERHALGVIRDITEQAYAENALKNKTKELKDRLRELSCLYEISTLMAGENNSLDEILRKAVYTIPASWQYPETACAKISLDSGISISSGNWEETEWVQYSDIISAKRVIGSIQVAYLEEKPGCDEGPFKNEERNLLDVLGIMIGDFIQKKKIEASLFESEQKFREMSNAALDAIIMMDDNGRVSYWNKAAEEMFGFKDSEIIGLDLHKIIVPQKYNDAFKEGLGEFYKTGTGKAIGVKNEFVALNKTGHEFPIELSLSTFKIKGQWNSIGIVRDVSDRKKIEQEIIDSEERFRGLYENSTLGIYRSTPDGKVIMANPAALSLLGYDSFEELTGINIADNYLDNPGSREKFKAILEKEGTIHGFESMFKRPDGKIISIRESARTIFNKDGKPDYYEGIFEDITEKTKVQEELLKAKERAEEINRLKTNFLANMSHELRTPITGITGFADLLKNELENEDQKQMAANILEGGERLSNALNLILDLSLLETNKLKIEPRKINIVEALEESIYSCMQATDKKGLQFLFEKKEKQIYCNLDPQLFGRSVRNFLDNAVKFTISGSISVKVFSNGQAVIQIQDTGIGIPKELLNVIFEPFRQGSEGYSRRYEGTGLGLTLAKKYIEISGGTVSVDSQEAIGTTFTIRFPEIKN